MVSQGHVAAFVNIGYLYTKGYDIDVLSKNPVIAQGFIKLAGALGLHAAESREFKRILNLFQPLMEYYVVDYGYANMVFVSKDGDVVPSVTEEDLIGTNLLLTVQHLFMTQTSYWVC